MEDCSYLNGGLGRGEGGGEGEVWASCSKKGIVIETWPLLTMDDGVIMDGYSGETAKYFLPKQSIVRFSDACFSTSKN